MKKILILILLCIFLLFSCEKEEYYYYEETSTTLQITVREYWTEKRINNINVRLYTSWFDWVDETNLIREGWTDYRGELFMDYLRPTTYYIDCWSDFYNNWDLAYEDINFIKVNLIRNQINHFTVWVDYTGGYKSGETKKIRILDFKRTKMKKEK
jgi:hypothetical protein